MTYRDRRAAKAERLREWADKRDAKAAAARGRVDAIADNIPLGQPILVGHHSERRARRDQERIRSGMRSTIEHTDKAAEFRRRADNIEAAADNAVYSDDRDAVERLEARIAEREAERDRIKAFNAATRKAGEVTAENLELLDERQREDLLTLARVAAWQLGKGGSFPGYVLSNLGASIRKDRERLPALRERAEARPEETI
jgi:hypothetical protein